MYPNNRKSNMKKWIVLTACCLAATLATAQEKKAYAIFDAEGRKTDYGEMLRALGERDVVFIGEVHNCPVVHWMELEIVKDLYALHGERLAVGAEMFERDDQLVLDEYLGGLISADRFGKETKLWDNYKTDYAPVVEFAKANGIPVIATNIPRRYANMVARGGFEALERLTDEARGYIVPLPLDYVPNESVDRYFAAMRMPGMKAGQAENLSKAQAIKDATMAWTIAQRIGEGRLVHLNGSFHSTAHAGILTYLDRFRPGLRIATVEVVRQDDAERLNEEELGDADFYICVPKDMTTTF